jgi:hypothetical protein
LEKTLGWTKEADESRNQSAQDNERQSLNYDAQGKGEEILELTTTTTTTTNRQEEL